MRIAYLECNSIQLLIATFLKCSVIAPFYKLAFKCVGWWCRDITPALNSFKCLPVFMLPRSSCFTLPQQTITSTSLLLLLCREQTWAVAREHFSRAPCSLQVVRVASRCRRAPLIINSWWTWYCPMRVTTAATASPPCLPIQAVNCPGLKDISLQI